MKTSFLFISLFVLLTGCTQNKVPLISTKQGELSILFSHNINGETHPCGCRHFPLGGLPQVAGQVHDIKSKRQALIVDTGDMLFPSSKVPASLEKSLRLTARQIMKSMARIGLKYQVPGDQDLAVGIEFYNELLKENKVQALVVNLKKGVLTSHKEWDIIKNGAHTIFITGLVGRDSMPERWRSLFTDENKALTAVIEKMKKKGLNLKNPFHRLVLLSHSGMSEDKKLANAFPEISWIIGSHTQDFTNTPYTQGEVKIVQTLSRNHYLGEIHMQSGKSKQADLYTLHEMRTNKGQLWKENPFYGVIDAHKSALEKVQLEEQKALSWSGSSKKEPLKSAKSCLECHKKQVDFWQGTSHSMAYITLLNAKAQHNSQCIGCHSLGYKNERGFISTQQVISLKDEKLKSSYLEAVKKEFSSVKSVRALSSAERKVKGHAWDKVNEKFKVAKNYANVQCLNCHTKDPEHPFAIEESTKKNYKAKCLSCHDKDQSPEWFKGSSEQQEERFNKHLKSVSCPKIETI